jgi:prolyl-tRNA editing enzyme YbaK/EbsC (Cys-tRNA(Pro) deacylase)
MFQALKAAVVGFFMVIQMIAEGLVEYAEAFKDTGTATKGYAKTLIPTVEQTEENLRIANASRDVDAATRAAKIKEAQDKLDKARNNNS